MKSKMCCIKSMKTKKSKNSCSFEQRWHLKCNHLSHGRCVPCLDSDYYELWSIIFLCYLYLFYNFLSQQKNFICCLVATKFYMIKIPSLVAIPYARRSEFRIDHPWVELVGLWHSKFKAFGHLSKSTALHTLGSRVNFQAW